MPSFNHQDLQLLNPGFDSPLVDVVTELEHLRRLELKGDTPPQVFFQLKHIFHMLESLGSARIEGNHTTLADYVESRLEQQPASDQLREMVNIEKGMSYIEDNFDAGQKVGEMFIRDLHSLVVERLDQEGDRTPGAYRQHAVTIAKADHVPPEALLVPQYMEELVGFINQDHPPKYDLMKVALAHHRFAWIHPFGNGNGRVVRLLTYMLIIKYGFNVKSGGRLLNPTAIFCNDRDRYYTMLGRADLGGEDSAEDWCIYVLQGMLEELQKVDKLTSNTYLNGRILTPALRHACDRGLVTDQEEKILLATARIGIAKAGDLQDAMPGLSSPQRTYQIRRLIERKMLKPIYEGARQYTVGFSNNYLIRGVIRALTAEGFIAEALNNPD